MPDRFSETARDVETCNLAASLLAEPLLGGFEVVVEGWMSLGVHRCLDERPPEVRGSVFRQHASAVLAAGLVDTRTQARVPAELFGRGESRDVPDLGRDGVREHPADPGDGHEVRDVRVLGAQGAQPRLQLSISASSWSMSRMLASSVPYRGSGRFISARRRRPVTPNRSDVGHRWPKVNRVAWIRFFRATRWRTR